MLPQGTVIDDRYEVVCAIGAGGHGSVHKAIQRQFDRLVAIKMLNTTLLHEAGGAERFEREARLIDELKHKNIVSVYGYGSWQNAPYMVMELIDGSSLDQLIEKEKRLEPKRAAMIMRQVFEALACSQHAGVVHRDLKPANILIIPDGQRPELVKIIDFGLAKLMPGYGAEGQKLTETGYALGTCHYMPPEQALGQPVDHRADIYAAGCILFHLLSGQLPFEGDDNAQLMFKHILEPFPELKTLRPDHPMIPALSTVVSNCVAKDRADRYETCEDAIKDLNRILIGNMHGVKPILTQKPKQRARLGRRGRAAIITLICLALLIFAGLFVHFQRENEIARRRAQTAINTAELDALITHANDLFDSYEWRSAVLEYKRALLKLEDARPWPPRKESDLLIRYVAAWDNEMNLKNGKQELRPSDQRDAIRDQAIADGIYNYLDRAIELREEGDASTDRKLVYILSDFGREADAIRFGLATCRKFSGQGDSRIELATHQRQICNAAMQLAFRGKWSEGLESLDNVFRVTDQQVLADQRLSHEESLLISIAVPFVNSVNDSAFVKSSDGKVVWNQDKFVDTINHAREAGFERYLNRFATLLKQDPDLAAQRWASDWVPLFYYFGKQNEATALSTACLNVWTKRYAENPEDEIVDQEWRAAVRWHDCLKYQKKREAN